MFSVSGSKGFCRFIICVACIAFTPPLSLPMVCHADADAIGGNSKLLSLQSALLQQWIPPTTIVEADMTRQMRRRSIPAVPEPYSLLLATFGAFGVLAMGTLFRRRMNAEQQTTCAKRSDFHGSKYSKHKRHYIPRVGRNR